jgi:hypothetical protein
MKTNGSARVDGAEGARDFELAADVLELLERSAAVPHGLAFVHLAPHECVAAALGVHPDTVERTCDCLDHEPRGAVIRAYSRALERQRTQPPAAPASFVARAPQGPDEVIARAEKHALGLQFLLCAPLETAAIMFSVHPEVVHEAREQLARRGVVAERSGDDA